MKTIYLSLTLGLLLISSCVKEDSKQGNNIPFYKIVGKYDGLTYMETLYNDSTKVISDSIENTLHIVVFEQTSIKIYDDINMHGIQKLQYSDHYTKDRHVFHIFANNSGNQQYLQYDETANTVMYMSANATNGKIITLWFASK